ncbi:MAG: SDR family oxidoreductase [Planctomycetota bacterium]|jgi:NAD(P)-dependent dehydrogenase (short-subunit alcohol dehydrogenase family)
MSESRTIVITGATRGLGRAMTDGFIQEGHTVIGCGRSLNAVKSVEAAHGEPHRFDCVDVASDAEVAAWCQAVTAEYGPPDLVLNNAAIINRNAPLWELEADEFDAVVDINVKGIANVLRHLLPSMVERGSGVIVNFSSGWGRSTSPEVAPYCATKYAVEGLTLALADELPHGMAAVPLNPGIINTELLQSCFGSSAHHYPTAEDWARFAVPYILDIDAADNGRQMTVSP